MNKRTKNLVIMLGICAICFGGYAISASVQKSEEDETVADTDTMLWAEGISDIEQIVLSDEKNISFTLKNQNWIYEPDSSFALDTDMVDNIAQTLQTFPYIQCIAEEDADLEEFGLTAPTMTIQFTENGCEHTLRVGNYNSVVSQYYVQKENDGQVYMVEKTVIDKFEHELYDFLILEEIPEVSSDYVSGVACFYDGNEYVYSYTIETVESETDSQTEETETTQQIVWYCSKNGGEQTACDEDVIATYVSNLLSISADSAADYNAGSKEKLTSKYGIGTDYVTVSYLNEDTEEEENYTIWLGNQNEDGAYYFTIGDSMQVQLLSEDVVSQIIEEI